MRVATEEAKERLDALLAREDGSAFKLVPSEPKKKRGLIGSAKGQIWMAGDFDEIPEGFEEYLP
ncbi:hypothetical protein BH20ACT10_BH20ACT10_21580 [soil metagenome]